MDRIQKAVLEARRIFPSLEEIIESDLSPDLAPRPRSRGQAKEGPMERAIEQERQLLLDRGRRALIKIEQGREGEITPEEGFGLEAIIHLEGRPAILIQGGRFMEPPRQWQILNEHRLRIDEVIQRVGRIEVSGHPNLDWVGTGFLVNSNIVMTNRHVAREFSRQSNGRWTFENGMKARIDFKEELGSFRPLEFKIVEVVGIHESLDLALLRVEKRSGDQALPSPLPVSSKGPRDLNGLAVYVVGYPAWDGRRNDPEPMRRIFMDIYNIKRLQPGAIVDSRLRARQIYHDCSTLGGNSGSPVIDMQTHRVIGLHFGGRYLDRNYAIPLWLLRKDPLIKGNVPFQ